MKFKSLIVMSTVLFVANITNIHARSLDSFKKRFQIVRTQDGKLLGIRDLTMPTKFQVAPYVEMIKNQIKSEQVKLNAANFNSEEYESEVRNLLADDLDQANLYSNEEYNKYVGQVVESLKKLAMLNVDGIFSNPDFKNLVSLYEGKMTEAILLLDPTLIANVNDSSYFYKKNVTYQVVSWGLNQARKRFSQIPFLNTMSYVVVEVEKLITERRQFHQNMLLHYLENYKEEELGLTHDEVNLIWSSIYESRIPWFAFWESTNAKSNWAKYGVNNFYTNYRQATNKLNASASVYNGIGERMNFAFQVVTYNNEKVAINLFDNENMFQNRPAIAHNFDKPTSIMRKRIMLNLASLGLSFVPLPPIIKDNVDTFIKSFYQKQKVTEGALFAYFESNGNSNEKTQIAKQYMNPFDQSL